MSLATITERQGWWDCWRAASFVWVGRDWRERLESVSSDGVVMAGNLLFPLQSCLRLDLTLPWNGDLEVTGKAWWRSWSLPSIAYPEYENGRSFQWSGVPQNEMLFLFLFLFFLVLIKLLSDTYQTLQPKSCALSTCCAYPATHSEEGTIRAPTHSLVRRRRWTDGWVREGDVIWSACGRERLYSPAASQPLGSCLDLQQCVKCKSLKAIWKYSL